MEIYKRKNKFRITFSKQLFYLMESRTTILAFVILFLQLMGCKKKLRGVQKKTPFLLLCGLAGWHVQVVNYEGRD